VITHFVVERERVVFCWGSTAEVGDAANVRLSWVRLPLRRIFCVVAGSILGNYYLVTLPPSPLDLLE